MSAYVLLDLACMSRKINRKVTDEIISYAFVPESHGNDVDSYFWLMCRIGPCDLIPGSLWYVTYCIVNVIFSSVLLQGPSVTIKSSSVVVIDLLNSALRYSLFFLIV